MAVIIQLRRDTAAKWTSINPTLNSGEFGVEIDTLKFKIGNGTTAWNSLPYGGGVETIELVDISDWPTAVTGTEVGYLDGVTSSIQTQLNGKVSSTLLGANNGVATLDATGKVPSTQLPSYVDDVLEYNNSGQFPTTGEAGKLYVALNDNSVYRWSGSTYIQVNNAVSVSDSAVKLQTPRTIAISGDGVWSVSFDGSTDVSGALTLANSGVTAGTYKSVTVDAKGRVTAGTNPTTLTGYGITDAATIDHTHSVATTSANGFMSSTDKTKLNGIATGAEVNQNAFSTIAVSGQSNVVADTKTDTLTLVAGSNITITTDAATDSITINASSSATTADKLTTARTISLSGDATGSVSFDGSANADIVVAVADDSHNHIIANVDGLQDALNAKQDVLVSGTTLKTINTESLLGPGNISISGSTNLTTTTSATTVTINSDTGTDAIIPAVTTSVAGVMTASDKTKLDGIATGANNYAHPTGDGNLHVPATGTTNNGKVLTVGATAGSLSWTAIPAAPVSSVAGKTGAVTLVKADVGLDNVDNTSDANKPVSTATQTALNAKQNTITGAATTITSSDLTASMAMVTDASGKVAAHGTVSATELGYLEGVTSGIQGQIDGKESTITTLAVSKGGTGVSTLTGLVKGNGTSAMTAAVAGTDYVVPSGSITGNAGTATTLRTARTINGISFDGSANITINAVDSTARIASSEKGAVNGVATLDATGKVPSTQLPSFVDDVLEYVNLAGFPVTGETGKIYVALDTNKTYRWSGSAYVYITSGAVDSVAGKTGVVTLVKGDVGLGSVDNTSDATKNVLSATKWTTARTVTIGGTGKAVDGTGNVSWTLAEIGAQAAGNYQPLDADLTAIAGLAGTSGFLKKTATDTWALDTSTYLTGNQSITFTGDATGSGTTSVALTLANTTVTAGSYGSATNIPVITVDAKGRLTSASTVAVSIPSGAISVTGGDITMSGNTGTNITNATLVNTGVTAGTYKSVTVDAKGRVTAGTNPTTLAGYGITDAATNTHNHTIDSLSNVVITANSDNEVLAWDSNTSKWINQTAAEAGLATSNHTHSDVTTSVSGFMSAADKTKLDGIATGANNYVHPTGDGNLHVPATSTTNNGKVLKAGATAGAISWQTLTPSDIGVTASATELNYVSGVTGAIQTQLDGKQAALGFTPENIANKGVANGYASLDATGKVPSTQLPSYVDDVLEYSTLSAFPGTGETGKIYVAIDTGAIYRWTGSVYVEISSGGTADTATKLTTARTIAATGDGTWSVNFDGSTNVSGAFTLAASGVTSGTYNSATQIVPFTVDTKGRITSVGAAVTIAPAFSSITGKPTTLAGYGIADAQPLDADLTAIAALAGTSGFLKKTAANTWSLDTSTYLTANQTITVSGDATGSGTTAIAFTLAASGVTSGTYNNSATQVTPFTVDAKGRITGTGTAVTITPAFSSITGKPTTLAGYGITDAATSTHTHGDISNTGTISSTAVTPADTDYILISDTSASGAIKRGIAIGTSTSTFLRNDGTWAVAGSGTVTSVALSLPAMFTVSGSPVTTSGTLTATLASQTANTVFAAPNGVAGAPTFRTLVAADIPSLDASKITTGTLGTARGGTGLTSFTQGGVLYASSTSALTTTAAGTTGQVLTSNGTGAPTWTTISGGATLSDDTTTNATYYPTFATATSGSMTTAKVASTKLTFNPSTGTMSATNFNALSDATLKENVAPIQYGTETVLASNPVQYDWKDGTGHSFGFIAQELEQLIPEAVQDTGNGIKAVNYGILTAVLFNTIKQLNSRISELESKLS